MDKSMTEGYCAEKYGHNFVGKYCWCDLSYNPDVDEMIQCLVCQDWYHSDCISSYPRHRSSPSTGDSDSRDVKKPQAEMVVASDTVGHEEASASGNKEKAMALPESDKYETFVCASCVGAHPLLRRMTSFAVAYSPTVGDVSGQQRPHGRLTEIELSLKGSEEQSLFLAEGWKTALCRCTECQIAFAEESLSFLHCKELHLNGGTAGAAVPPSIMDVSMSALEEAVPSVSRRLDLARGMQHFTDTLRSVLSPLAERGETVTPEHIKDFVAQLKKK